MEFVVHGRKLEFPMEVHESIILNDRIIVLLWAYNVIRELPNEDPCRNVWCYDFDGNVLWKIQRSYFPDKDDPENKKKWKDLDEPYSGISASPEENTILAHARRKFILNPNDGTVQIMPFRSHWD